MSNKVYDVLKILAQIILPFAAMIVSILGAVGITQYGEVILAIATAINTFIGVLLKLSSDKYWGAKDDPDAGRDEANG